MIYLDHNATTPVSQEVFSAMAPYLSGEYGNPSSAYPLGRVARDAVESARNEVANLFGCETREVVFTSGGTESNNTVIKGVAYTHRRLGAHIITTAIEHPAVINPCLFLLEQGYEITFLPVDSNGLVDANAVENAFREATILVSVMHANNETGSIQPVEEIGRLCRQRGIPFHTDAAQSAGKIPLDVESMNLDFLSIAGHKLYAPKGIGALYVRDGVAMEPLLHGAGQESGRRAGTENVALAVALGTACRLAIAGLTEHAEKMRTLRDRLHHAMAETIPGIVLNGHPEARLPNTLNLSFPGIDGAELLKAVPEIAASTGAACHDRSVRLSHVLAAMNVPEEVGRGAVRLTLGRDNTAEAVDAAAEMLISAYRRLTRSSVA